MNTKIKITAALPVAFAAAIFSLAVNAASGDNGRTRDAPLAQSQSAQSLMIGDLEWRRNVGAPPIIERSNPAAITQTLEGRSATKSTKVTLGFNDHGGGYLWSVVLEGFSRNGDVGNAGYGGGLQGEIHDLMHRNAYDLIPAGLNNFTGVRTKVMQTADSVLVPQFQLSLYSAGSANGKARFRFSNSASEFDFTSLTKDASARFGIPAFSQEEYFAYARSPDAIKQFVTGTIGIGPEAGEDVLDPGKRVNDVSSSPGLQTARDTDLSLLVHTVRGLRPPADFKYLFYRSANRWITKILSTAASGDGPLTCYSPISADQKYSYAAAENPLQYNIGAGCQLDIPLFVFSTSADPSAGTAMALYVPEDDPSNARQVKIVDRTSMTIQRTEDRRLRSTMFVGQFVKPSGMNPLGYWIAGSRNYLSGLLSPQSASDYDRRDSMEILTDKSYIFFGTPNEIYQAIKSPGVPVRMAAAPKEAYDVIVVAGQSNAVGRGLGPYEESAADLNGMSRVYQLGRIAGDNMKIIPATEPLQHWGQRRGTSIDRKGFAYHFALRYASKLPPGRKVLIIPAAQGSTSILQWDDIVQPDARNPFKHGPMQDSTVLYDDMLMRIKYVLAKNPGSKVVAVLWSQGETDVLEIANPRNDIHEYMSNSLIYQRKLEELLSRLRTALSSQECFPFLVAEFARSWAPLNGRAEGLQAKNEVTAAIKQAVASDPCKTSALVSSAGIGVNTDRPNDPHYSAAGAMLLGDRFYSEFERIAGARTAR